ncbi:chemotaxis protein CheA [Azospirillum soli]|uniref:chemotaxis protein CheA n=1 Tax=Azospirillum soli TaxID=1304799 RepID=UPI001AEA97F9|nr:chemotaxis protein CheA [Azospirillum soli]MBP2314267.1 two-component system chemotaxis sensor kinase CheA [Azospirillum soli]
MNPLLAQFLVEAREQIGATTDGLLGLERAPGNTDLLNGVFRSVHTLKGSSGLFEFPALTSVLHAGEDLLVALREHRLVLDPAMLDQVLAALDLVSGWLDHIDNTGLLPDDAAGRGTPVIAALRAWLGGSGLGGPVPAAPVETAAKGAGSALPSWLREVPEAVLLDTVERAAATGTPLLAVSYRPETQCFFKGDDPFALIRQLPDGLYLDVEEPAAWSPLAETDPFSCIVGFRALSAAPRDEVRHLLRYVDSQSEVVEFEAAQLVRFAGSPVGDPLARELGGALVAHHERGDRASLAEAAATLLDTFDGTADAAVLRWIARLAPNPTVANPVIGSLVTAFATGTCPAVPEPAGPADAGGASEAEGDLPSPVVRLLHEQMEMLHSVRNDAWIGGCIGSAAKLAAKALRYAGRRADAERIADTGEKAFAAKDAALLVRAIEEILGKKPAKASDAARPKAATPGTSLAAVPALHDPAHERASTVLRVDQSRIDALMNLIGELVVAKNGLPFLARRAENVYGSREMAREIKEQHAVIDRIALELRNSIMQVRMLPVSTVFQRFPRLVRDLSRKLGKHVELVIEGEDTQADKTVIENLFEPILHLVRNSLDHGIETDRDAMGKPEAATLTLSASQDNDQVVIRVADDGRGIDPTAMRRKAVEKGLLDEEAAGRLTDEEAVNLIFAAGFSTAAEVTDVSGRGVGMDAVRTTIEKAGGRVDVSSRIGAGTTVSLHLPLSMAVTRVMTLSVSGSQFGIPMDEIAETVRIPRSDVVAIKDKEAFLLRDRIIPLVHLDRALSLPPKEEAEEIAVLVVHVDKQPIGLAIEAFGEGMEVIVKPLEGPLTDLPDYLGTALLGDGRVLLVLNLKEVLE